jgi:hypothetical protein
MELDVVSELINNALKTAPWSTTFSPAMQLMAMLRPQYVQY